MALHPVGDQLKVKLDKKTVDFGPTQIGAQTGVVVEVPEVLHYYGKHSQMLEQSFMAKEKLEELLDYYRTLIGKRVAWEALQDRGRHFIEVTETDNGDDTEIFVFLKMSDILLCTDSPDEEIMPDDDNRSSAGSFNL